MSLQIEDILKLNLVLVGIQLLSSDEEASVFDAEVDSEVLESVAQGIEVNFGPSGLSASVPQSPAPRVLSLEKDRIMLDLNPGRSTITRNYPDEASLGTLSQIASLAIAASNLTGQELRAFGFNIEAVYRLTSEENAVQFLASRILVPNLFRQTGFQLVGGSPRLRLERDGNLWNFTIEPRLGDPNSNRIFISLNLHVEGDTMPSEGDIRESLKQVWDQAHAIVRDFE